MRAGGVAVLGGESKRTKNFHCGGNFPTVEVEMLGVRGGGAAGDGAERSGLQKSDWSVRKGIAAVEFDFLGA